MNDKDRLTQ